MNIKKPAGGVRILLGILSVLLCVLLFVSTVVTMVIADVRVAMSEENLKTIISGTLFSAPKSPVRYPAGIAVGVMPRLAAADTEGSTQDAIVEWVYNLLKEQFGDKMDVSMETVRSFLDQSTLKDFLSGKIASIISDIYTGQSTTTLTRDEIAQQLNANADLIESTMGYRFTDEDISQIAHWVESSGVMDQIYALIEDSMNGSNSGNTDVEIGQTPTGSGSNSGSSDSTSTGGALGGITQVAGVISTLVSGGTVNVGTALSAARTVTSASYLVDAIAVCVILMGLLFLTNYYKLHAALRDSGITVMAASLIFVIPSVFALVMPGALGGSVAGKLVIQVLSMTAGVAIGVFVLGAAMMAGGIVLGSLLKKKAAA